MRKTKTHMLHREEAINELDPSARGRPARSVTGPVCSFTRKRRGGVLNKHGRAQITRYPSSVRPSVGLCIGSSLVTDPTAAIACFARWSALHCLAKAKAASGCCFWNLACGCRAPARPTKYELGPYDNGASSLGAHKICFCVSRKPNWA